MSSKLCEKYEDVIAEGERNQNYNHILKDMRTLSLTEDNIQLMCDRFGFKCNFVSNVVFLTTPVGYWRVYIANDKVTKVFHGNYKGNQTEFFKKRKCSEGFHRQDISLDNFYDVVRYIYHHDKNMYKSKKKCRMELLFEKIEKESAEKHLG